MPGQIAMVSSTRQKRPISIRGVLRPSAEIGQSGMHRQQDGDENDYDCRNREKGSRAREAPVDANSVIREKAFDSEGRGEKRLSARRREVASSKRQRESPEQGSPLTFRCYRDDSAGHGFGLSRLAGERPARRLASVRKPTPGWERIRRFASSVSTTRSCRKWPAGAIRSFLNLNFGAKLDMRRDGLLPVARQLLPTHARAAAERRACHYRTGVGPTPRGRA